MRVSKVRLQSVLGFFNHTASPSARCCNCIKKANPITLWSLTLLTLTPFARFENWRISWEGSTFCEKVGKRLESGAIDMPQVCEGCTSETKVKLLAERGAFFANCAVRLSVCPCAPPPSRGSNGTVCKKTHPSQLKA